MTSRMFRFINMMLLCIPMLISILLEHGTGKKNKLFFYIYIYLLVLLLQRSAGLSKLKSVSSSSCQSQRSEHGAGAHHQVVLQRRVDARLGEQLGQHVAVLTLWDLGFLLLVLKRSLVLAEFDQMRDLDAFKLFAFDLVSFIASGLIFLDTYWKYCSFLNHLILWTIAVQPFNFFIEVDIRFCNTTTSPQ